jgi:hypothetical protein
LDSRILKRLKGNCEHLSYSEGHAIGLNGNSAQAAVVVVQSA